MQISPGMASLRGCVNFFFSAAIHGWAGSDCHFVSWTKALQFNIQAEGWVSMRQTIMYDYKSKSYKNQRLKSEKQAQRGVQFQLFFVTYSDCEKCWQGWQGWGIHRQCDRGSGGGWLQREGLERNGWGGARLVRAEGRRNSRHIAWVFSGACWMCCLFPLNVCRFPDLHQGWR